jgi:AcrR family transcriptional regulator
MVVTPWGDSTMLRDRMLRPGPGAPPQKVTENQRRRLFAAMVASVAEHGYAKTRFADLVEISGVSSGTFYEHFADKRACFSAALDSLLSAMIEQALEGVGDAAGEEGARKRLRRFAEMVAEQPAAAKMGLVESFVAGPEAIGLVEGATRRAEALVRAGISKDPGRKPMPEEMVIAMIAAVLQVFRSRLLAEVPQRLPGLADGLASFLLSYEPPARPLRTAARAPEVRQEELEAGDHGERALRAFEALLARQPYAETTMEQVAERAKMSVRTLYANFGGREELMLAAIDSAGAQAVAVTLPAFRRGASQPEGIRAAFAALLGLLASRPNLANFLLRSSLEGGAEAVGRRAEALRPIESLLVVSGMAPDRLPATPRIASETILGAILGLARRRLVDSGSGTLSGLVSICTYLALAPLLGTEQATAAAEGKSYRRTPADVSEALGLAAIRSAPDRLLIALSNGSERVEDIARSSSLSAEEVEEHLSRLEQAGVVIAAEGPGQERIYRSLWATVTSEEWGRLEQDDREATSQQIWWLARREVEEAIEARTFDSRPERSLIRLAMGLDDEGLRALSRRLDATLEDCFAIQEDAERRRQESSSPSGGFPVRVMLITFESPPEGE